MRIQIVLLLRRLDGSVNSLNSDGREIRRVFCGAHRTSVPKRGLRFSAEKSDTDGAAPSRPPEQLDDATLRHRLAWRAYRGSRNLRAVQALLGHEAIAMTEYLGVGDDEIRAAMTAAVEPVGLAAPTLESCPGLVNWFAPSTAAGWFGRRKLPQRTPAESRPCGHDGRMAGYRFGYRRT